MDKAVILGVGPNNGLGAKLAKRFATKNLHIFISGRTESSLTSIAKEIEDSGGTATAIPCDATKEEEIISLFKAVGKNLKLAIYNAGNNTPGKIIDMNTQYFRECWEVLCLGGFIFGREALKIFSNKKMGTLIYTGASASLRGKANFGAFNSGKAALRTLAQAMSKEYGPQGIHIGHIVIDGAIGGEKIWIKNPDYAKKLGKEGLINLDGIVESYVYLYNQPKEAWTFELDLRTSIEKW